MTASLLWWGSWNSDMVISV